MAQGKSWRDNAGAMVAVGVFALAAVYWLMGPRRIGRIAVVTPPDTSAKRPVWTVHVGGLWYDNRLSVAAWLNPFWTPWSFRRETSWIPELAFGFDADIEAISFSPSGRSLAIRWNDYIGPSRTYSDADAAAFDAMTGEPRRIPTFNQTGLRGVLPDITGNTPGAPPELVDAQRLENLNAAIEGRSPITFAARYKDPNTGTMDYSDVPGFLVDDDRYLTFGSAVFELPRGVLEERSFTVDYWVLSSSAGPPPFRILAQGYAGWPPGVSYPDALERVAAAELLDEGTGGPRAGRRLRRFVQDGGEGAIVALPDDLAGGVIAAAGPAAA